MTPDVERLRAATRAFVREIAIPQESAAAGQSHGPDDNLRRLLQRQARDAGIFAPTVPTKHGGLGLDMSAQAIVLEAAGYSLLGPLALNCAAPDEGTCTSSKPGGAMSQTFQNSAQVLSIGIFFTLMIIGLAATLPASLAAGLHAHGVPASRATHISHLPPVSVLFAAFLGYDPVRTLIGPHVIGHLSAANAAALTNRNFFPSLIAEPFRSGLHKAFAFAICACLLAAVMSWSRGRRYVATESRTPTAELIDSPEPDTI